jgi:signal transduction histidine kinase
MVLLVSITLALATALVWLGWLLVRQDRSLERQRAREQLESAAAAVTTALKGRLARVDAQLVRIAALPASEAHAALSNWGTDLSSGALVLGQPGSRVEGYPSGRLLAYPGLPAFEGTTPSAFAAAERLEFRTRNLDSAAAVYSDLANSSGRDLRAGALLRLGRTLRKAGKHPEALAAYRRLGDLDSADAGGVPAGLAGRYAALELLEPLPPTQSSRAEAESLLTDLLTGRWRLSRSAFEYHLTAVRNRLDGGTPPRALPSSARGTEAPILTLAVDSLWAEWAGAGAVRSVGRRVLVIDSTPVLAIWRSEPGKWFAWLATVTHLEGSWRPELDSVLQRDGVQAGVKDSSGMRMLSDLVPETEPELVHSLAELGLPWFVEVARLDRTSDDEGLADRRRILLAGLLVAASLALVGTYAVTRAVGRELHVARLQSDFVSAVSHEFRTPLTSLRQLTELLSSDRVATEERRRTYYDVLRRESLRLHRLVEGLLDFGRMEAGRREYRLEPVDAGELVRGVVGEFQAEPACAGHRISLELPPPPCGVRADREALARALWNLLDNAVKYSPDAAEIVIAVARENGRVAIEVRDRGPGIPEAEQQSIFEKFVRGTAAHTSGARGTGLGLAMVRTIAGAHGGQVRVSSAVGEGSTFTLVLPAERSE